MAPPAISGITELVPYESGATGWSIPAVVGVAPPGGAQTRTGEGFNGGTAVRLRGRTGAVALCSAEYPTPGLNLTTVDAIYGLLATTNSNGLQPFSGDGIQVGFSDALGNYSLFTLGGSDVTTSDYQAFVLQSGQSADAESLTPPDASSITAFIAGYTTTAASGKCL